MNRKNTEHRVRANLLPDAGGTSMLPDNGIWEVVGGTGKLKGLLQSPGTLHVRRFSQTDCNVRWRKGADSELTVPTVFNESRELPVLLAQG